MPVSIEEVIADIDDALDGNEGTGQAVCDERVKLPPLDEIEEMDLRWVPGEYPDILDLSPYLHKVLCESGNVIYDKSRSEVPPDMSIVRGSYSSPEGVSYWTNLYLYKQETLWVCCPVRSII